MRYNDTSDLQLRFSAPGRERWLMPALKSKPLLAEQLKLRLIKYHGFIDVKVNPITARILIVFEQSKVKQQLKAIILKAYENIISQQIATDSAETHGSLTPNKHRETDQVITLLKSVETDSSTRWQAIRMSLLSSISYMSLPVSLGMIMVVPVSGGITLLNNLGFSVLQQIGLFGTSFLGARALVSKLDHKTKNQWQTYATDIEHRLRTKSFAHLTSLDMPYLENQSSSQLVSLIHDDIANIRKFIESVPYSVIDKVSTVAIGSLLAFLISPVPFFLTIAPFPVIYWLFKKYHKQIAEKYQVLADKEGANKKLLSNSFTGLSTIKSFATEEYELQRLKESSKVLQESKYDAHRMSSYYANTTQYAIAAGVALPMIYAGGMVYLGTLSASVYLLLSFFLPRLVMIMTGLERDYDLYQNAISSTQRLSKMLATDTQILDGNQSLPVSAVKGKLEFEKVSFNYPSSNLLFEQFNLTIEPNKITAFVGGTGSGKSTLIKLLLRLYDINEGQISLDDQDISQLKIRDLRDAIGLVSQDVFLFHGTIFENILYGRMDATYEEVIAAAKIAEAFDFIQSMPEGFDTLIGERGQKLSGGQRQRISIARVMLKDPPILVLDEATSSVDNETEAVIQRSIERIAKDKTMVLIAHRLSTTRYADQIHVIDKGKIVESGTHDELLDRDKNYASLWKLQTGER